MNDQTGTIISWGIAEAVSTRSSCARRKVGAVIVLDKRIRGTGYNDSPAGDAGCESCPRRTSDVPPGSSYDTGPGSCVAIHAEANALLYAQGSLRGSTLYLTCAPCGGCCKLIKAAGVLEIVYKIPNGYIRLADNTAFIADIDWEGDCNGCGRWSNILDAPSVTPAGNLECAYCGYVTTI